MENGRVAVILVNYNGEKVLIDCIRSIKKQTYQNVDIILVDNHSTDESVKIVELSYPDIMICKLENNKGFTGGNNVGIKLAREMGYDYLMLLNTDTEIDEKLIERLLDFADENTAVIPAIYSDKGKKAIWYGGGKMCLKDGKCYNRYYTDAKKPMEVTYMVGCCMFLHSNIFNKIGDFDDNYFLYYEDGDLSMRMLLAGVKMFYVPDTWVWHKVQFKTLQNYMIYYMTRNYLYFIKKYSQYVEINAYKVAVQNCLTVIRNLSGSNFNHNKYILLATKDFFIGKKGERAGITKL